MRSCKGGIMEHHDLYRVALEIAKIVNTNCKTQDEIEELLKLIKELAGPLSAILM